MSKKPALILIPVGFAFTAIYYIVPVILIGIFSNQLEDDVSNILGIVSVILIVFLIISAIIMALAIFSLRNNEKSIVIGVLTIIFVSAIGGIFYLIWKPARYHIKQVKKIGYTNTSYVRPVSLQSTTKPIQEKPVEQPIEKEESINPYESLEKLKKLLDSGIIDKETYDAKAKKYIDML